MMRKKIVAGNWKMNLDKQGAKSLTQNLLDAMQNDFPSDVDLVVCTPFIHLDMVGQMIASQSNLFLGAQNCNENESGAFTGEISVSMLKSYGVDYVIIGHSERRQYFDETHEEQATKVDLALAAGLKVIFCCGEVLEEREGNMQETVVLQQLAESTFHLSEEQFANLVIAYEPVWAIGTGKTASAAQAQEMHAFIRKIIAENYNEQLADATTIQYGGSCKPSNAKEIFDGEDVDGGLIGGAALSAKDFVAIAQSY